MLHFTGESHSFRRIKDILSFHHRSLYLMVQQHDVIKGGGINHKLEKKTTVEEKGS